MTHEFPFFIYHKIVQHPTMNWVVLFLVVVELILSLVFYTSDVYIRRLLCIPICSIHISLWYNLCTIMDKLSLSLYVKTSFRFVKYILILLSINMTQCIFYSPYTSTIYIGSIIIMAIDLIRAFLFEIVNISMRNRISHGIFKDILVLEPFLCSKKMKKQEFTIEDFYKLGCPTRVDTNLLFDLWNDESVKVHKKSTPIQSDECSLLPEAEEISNEARVLNKKALIHKKNASRIRSPYIKKKQIDEKLKVSLDALVKPETYLFKQKLNEVTKECDFVVDSDEVISDDDAESVVVLNEIQQKDHDANLWIQINEEVRKAQQRQPVSGRVTKESLQAHFNDDASVVYNILTFNRSEDLNYTVFRDNMRQINNERENLYTTIVCNRNLVSQIYRTLIGIECLVFYWIISNWLHIQPLLVKLCIPIFILPAFSSIKVILESFLFIVYSHPYDPGDRITLDGENYIVRDISLLTTTFIRWDGYKCVIGNVQLRNKAITNVRRSGAQTWNVQTYINATTTDQKINELRMILKRLKYEDKAYSNITMYTEDILDTAYILLSIHVKHNYNFQNGFLMWNNHTKFLRILSAAFTTIGIKYLPLKREVILKE